MKTDRNIEDMSAEDVVKTLLRPLNIHCYQTQVYYDRYDRLDRIKMFECNKGISIDFIDPDGSRCIGTFKDYPTMIGELFNYVKMFVMHWDSETFDNPYFGCKSVEEAMIRMDLLRGKEDAQKDLLA